MITRPIAMDWSGRMAGHCSEAPGTSQASPRARRVSTTCRAPMKTPLNATQTAEQAAAEATAARATGRVGREHDHAGPGQVAAVAGADQHTVEDEHDAGDRLPEGGDQQHRDEQVLYGGVPVNRCPRNGLAAASRSPVTNPLTRPHRTIRRVTSRVPSTSPAPRSAR